MLFGKRQERLPLQAKCRKGKPCGAICIPKGSSCREGKRTGDNEVTRYNQEYIASLFTQSVNPWTGQPDFQKFRSLPRVEQQKALKSAYRWLEDAKVEKKTRKDASAGADGKCGPGWKPAPGGKCVRSKRAAFKEGVKGYFFGAKGTERYNNRRAEGRGRLAAMGVRSGLSALGMTASTGIAGLQVAGAAGLIKPPRQQGGSQKSGADRYGDKPLSKGFKKKGITKEDLEKSRRKARIKNHPDRGGTPEEVARRTKKFQQTEAAYFRAARRSGIKLDSLKRAIMSLRNDASAGADGKCGPGWKPGPGGRCVRGARAGAKEALKRYLLGKAGTARYNNLRQQGTGRLASVGVKGGLRALGMTAATGYVAADQASYAIARKKSADANRQRKVDRIAKKVEQRAYDKNFESRMAESFDPKVADFQGKKAAMGAREKFERRAKVKANADSLGLSRLDGSRKNNKDSLMDDYYSEIAQIIEYSQGIRVDSIYGLEDQGSSIVGIASSGGDFFEFEIDSRSTGVAPRPDLTHSANERARGALSAMGISYRGDSAYEFLCGMEFREDNLGQSAKAAIGRVKSAVMGGVNRVKQAFGSKPATPAPASGGKRRMLKRAAKIGAGLAVAGGGVAAYKNRDKIKAAAPGISSAAQGAARDVGRSAKQAGRRALGAVGYMT